MKMYHNAITSTTAEQALGSTTDSETQFHTAVSKAVKAVWQTVCTMMTNLKLIEKKVCKSVSKTS